MRPELPPNAFVGIVTDPTSVPTAQAAAWTRMHDMQAAVRWSRANADLLGIDPDRIVAGGHVGRGDHGPDGRLQRGRPRHERHPG